ncbi:MAG TPA: hypothetical protein VMY42_20865 [Thermoguttaceae bacterium]|nr:hypothetical protein [Thermoguttaceae bacterium]
MSATQPRSVSIATLATTYPNLARWREDNDLTPTIGGTHHTRKFGRTPVTEGLVARAERLLLRNTSPESVAESTGLRLNIVNAIAERVAREQVLREDAALKQGCRSRARQLWLDTIRAQGLERVHLALLDIAESLHRAGQRWDAHHMAYRAVVLFLRSPAPSGYRPSRPR